MVTVKTVKQYNLDARFNYEMAVADWKPGQGFPCLAMFLFEKDNGEARRNGYIVSDGTSHHFYQAKELKKYINAVPNREFQMLV
jgi:hypothetical protein